MGIIALTVVLIVMSVIVYKITCKDSLNNNGSKSSGPGKNKFPGGNDDDEDNNKDKDSEETNI